jgi:MoaA/NifB/PqqE/SkfB family radical SAM enzyme
VKAVSFGGGEPLEYIGLFDVLLHLRGRLFRSLTTNGLLLSGRIMDRLVAAAPEKVQVSIHFPELPGEVARVLKQVQQFDKRGIPSGINFLVRSSQLAAAREAAMRVRGEGISADRIVYLPMRGFDTPTPEEVADVAGKQPFQSIACLNACRESPRFCSIAWDKTVAWCSYTVARRPLETLTYDGLISALRDRVWSFAEERTASRRSLLV